jgi:hypothetical protein
VEKYVGAGQATDDILNLDTDWKLDVSLTPWPLYPQGM